MHIWEHVLVFFDIVKFVVKLNNCTDAHKGSHNTDGPYFNHCEVCDN